MNKNSSLFVLSNFINRFGDAIDLIAFMWIAYETTGSVILTGVVAAFNGLPSVVLGLFSGLISDHISKKKMIILGDICRGVIVFAIAFLYIYDCLNIYILCISTVFISTFEIISAPARRSILPFLVQKEKIKTANSFNSMGKNIANIVGLSLAGFIISHFSLAIAIIIDAVTFFLSATFICLISYKENVVSNDRSYALLSDFIEGLGVIKNEKTILKTTIIATVVNLFMGGFNIMVLSYCKDVIGNDSQGQSIINALSVFGLLCMSLLFSCLKNIDLDRAINIGFIGLGVSLILFGFCDRKLMAYLIAMIYGMSVGGVSISSVTILHHNIPLKHMGKVMALVGIINESSIPFGNLWASFLIERIRISNTFILSGIMIIACTLLLLYVFRTKRISLEDL